MTGAPAPSPFTSWLARIFLSPSERRLRAGWRLLGQFALMGFCLIVFGILGTILLGLNSASPLLLVMSEVTATLAVTLSILLARRFLDRRTFASLGLTIDLHSLLDLGFGFILPGLLMGLIYAAEWALGWLKFDGLDASLAVPGTLVIEIVGWLFFFVLVGWQEELLSRGYWLQNLADGLNLPWGVIISSCFFALAHSFNPNVSWIAILGLVCSGYFLAFGYLRTRRLWLPIGLHIGWNFFEGIVFGFPVSGLGELFHLVHQTVNGPVWFTGGAFGPEAGLVQLPALGIGMLLMLWYTSRRKI